ncbi:conserved hypothetical protein [Frankia sp. Hr75.2]|uniref:hypothetical protein n=1 Tax=Parafrankia soli TaxID=2599596 RepID=UPI0028A42848|nr:conserved hypothetical protein [Frankia sp. Hr75.2]
MSYEQVENTPDPLDRASLADELMWTPHPHRLALRDLRSDAIRASLAAGIPSDQIAAKLHVKISDLEWMSRLTTVAPAA